MKKINVLILGSTGMVGGGVLLECLKSPAVASVLLINRRVSGLRHEKLEEIVCPDIFELKDQDKKSRGAIGRRIKKINACFFCLGVSSVGMLEKKYSHLTYDLTLGVANYLKSINKNITFVYVSGAGTDSSESGRVMWARVKGKTENELLGMGFKDAYMFRPAFIKPAPGIKSKTKLYQFFITLVKPLYFTLKRFKNVVTSSEQVGQAMIRVSISGFPEKILENRVINDISK